MTIKYYLACAILLFLSSFQLSFATTYTVKSVPNPYNQASVIYVVDPDNILDQTDSDAINNRLNQLEKHTDIETVVVALPSIGSVDTREFANKLFNHWKIGKKDKDNGLLILLVIDQREVVFEVGYGLEGNLTDAKSYRLMDQYMLPLFRQNQFSQGMTKGVAGVASYLEKQYDDGTLYSIGFNPLFINLVTYIVLTIIVLLPVIYCLWGDRFFISSNFIDKSSLSIPERLMTLLNFLSWSFFVIALCLTFMSAFTQSYNSPDFSFLVIPGLFLTIFILQKINKKLQSIVYKNPQKVPHVCPKCRHKTVIQSTQDFKDILSKKDLFQYEKGSASYYWFACSNKKCYARYFNLILDPTWKHCTSCDTHSMKYITRVITQKETKTKDGLGYDLYKCQKCNKKHQSNFMTKCEKSIRDRAQAQENIRYNERYTHSYRNTNTNTFSSSSGGFKSSGSSFSNSGSSFRGGGSSGGGGSRGRF